MNLFKTLERFREEHQVVHEQTHLQTVDFQHPFEFGFNPNRGCVIIKTTHPKEFFRVIYPQFKDGFNVILKSGVESS